MEDDNDITLAEAFEFFADRSEEEEQAFADENETDIPDHAEALVAAKATDLLKTVTSIDMAYVMADDEADVATEEMEDELAESVVDLLATVGTLKYERDIDIAGAVEERIDFIKQYQQFEEAMEEAETKDEQFEAMDEYLTDELAEEMGVDQGPKVGQNVDREDYEHDEVGRTFQ